MDLPSLERVSPAGEISTFAPVIILHCILAAICFLIPYLLGLLIGIVFIAKLMNFLLKKHAALTFSAIFGLVIGSPVALLMQNRECFQIATAGNWIISIVCLVIGFAVAWFMSTLDKKQSESA